MPNSVQAKKRMRQDDRRRAKNRAAASHMKTEMKRVLAAVEEGNLDAAEKAMPEAFKRIDKAAKTRVIHPNSASHKKSRLARAIQRARNS